MRKMGFIISSSDSDDTCRWYCHLCSWPIDNTKTKDCLNSEANGITVCMNCYDEMQDVMNKEE